MEKSQEALTPMEKVFALDELLELILGFYCSTCPTKNSKLASRTVCKSFQRTAFTALLESQVILEVDISTENTVLNFAKVFSSICHLPIHVKISNTTWKLEQLLFMQTYSSFITEISFHQIPSYDFGHLRGVPDLQKIFPRLKTIQVFLPAGTTYFSPNETSRQFLDSIMRNAKKLEHLGLLMNWTLSTVWTKVLDIPFSVTHVDLCCKTWNDDVGRCLLLADKLAFLRIHVREARNENTNYSIAAVVRKYHQVFKSLVLIVESDTLVNIPVGDFRKLHSLQLGNVLLEKFDEPGSFWELSSLVLNQDLSIAIENLNTINDSIAEVSKLDSLVISTSDPEDLDDFTETLIGVLLKKTINCMPHLTIFKCDILYPQVAVVVLPALFSNLTNLVNLNIEFKSYQDAATIDAHELLSGVTEESVPTDSAEWETVLLGGSETICHLSRLKRLEMANYTDSEVNLSPFLFKSFAMISGLKDLKFSGNFTMNRSASGAWLQEVPGRTLDF